MINKLHNLRSTEFRSDTFFNPSFEREFSRKIKHLDNIREQLSISADDFQQENYQSLLDIFEKSLSEENFETVFKSRAKLRRLLYVLSYYVKKNDEPSFQKVRKVFDFVLHASRWRERLILPLHKVVFSFYDRNNKSYQIYKASYLSKIKTISEDSRYHSIKEISSLIEPEKLVEYIIKEINESKNFDFNTFCKSLFLSTSYLYQSHFAFTASRLAMLYQTEEVVHFFLKLLSDFSDLPVALNQVGIANMVTITEKFGLDVKDEIRTLANRIIGDPSIDSKWAPSLDLNEKDKRRLSEAREIMKRWVNERFVEFFFEYSVDNKYRRLFWKKLSEHITELRINGTYFVRKRLEQNDDIRELLISNPKRFVRTNDSNTAVIMKIRDRYFIEYSEMGRASYCFLENNRRFLSIYNRSSFDPSSFIDGSMPVLFNREYKSAYNLKNEGRVSHRGEHLWIYAYAEWFRRVLGIKIDL